MAKHDESGAHVAALELGAKFTARNNRRSGQHCQSIITAYWKQAELW